MRTIGCLVFALAICGSAAADWFSDDFDDGVINPTYWIFGGNGIAEGGGVLNMDRDGTDDYVETTATFSGDWTIEVVIRLNQIQWNDMFHGISITDATGTWGYGVSFGFSMYGKLYRGQHDPDGSGIGYDYGPANSNHLGQWQTWTFEKTGNTLAILVDGQPVIGQWSGHPLGGSVPDNVTIRFPGLYEDGDGGGYGITRSDLDFFSIASAGVPCPEDLNGNGTVDLPDLARLLATYGLCAGDPGFDAAADFDGDGCVLLADLAQMLGVYGTPCP